MARAKTTPAPKEVKLITKEQLSKLREVKHALDNATDEIRNLGENSEDNQMTIGFVLGQLYESLTKAYEQADGLYEELDTDDDVEEIEF